MTQTSASSRKDIRAAEKELAATEAERGGFITRAMSTKDGRLWIHAQLEYCHIFNDPFSGDALVEAYNKGERNVGLRLLADVMKYALANYITMMEEANVRNTIAEQRRSQNARRDDEAANRDYTTEPGDGEEGRTEH